MAGNHTFCWHDTGVNVWQESANPSDWGTFDALVRLLRREGFRVVVDPEQVKRDGRKFARGYRVGNKGDLRVHLDVMGRRIEVGFYQDLVKENPNGGRYDFGKLAKMPCLIRLAFLNVRRKLSPLLIERGYRDNTAAVPADAMAAVMSRRAETAAFHRDMYRRTPEDYNRTDADKRPLADGDVRYFRTRKGHLLRGRVFYNLNNMWWVVVNKDHWTNMACWQLFTYAPGMPRKSHPDPKGSVERQLKRAVERQEFERAIPLRNRVRELAHAAGGEGRR